MSKDLKDIEKKLQEIILPDLKRGRAGWDLPHTEAAVFYIKEIIENSPELQLNPTVLIAAAYAHDWGYADYFNSSGPLTYDQVADAKKHHMKAGADKISRLLRESDFGILSEDEKNRISHLVQIHDDLANITEVDERVLAEADTLAGVDINKAAPTFDKISNDKYMAEIKTLRQPLFLTNYGKNKLGELLEERTIYYETKK